MSEQIQDLINRPKIMRMVYDAINENPDAPNIHFPDEHEDKAIIDFHSYDNNRPDEAQSNRIACSLSPPSLIASAAVMENIGTYTVTIIRHGKLSDTVRVRVETIDGSALEDEDYQPINEILTFVPDEMEKEIGVTIIDDNQWEPDEEFFIKLTLCPGEDSENVRLGRTSIMEITILNDDEPGLLQFEKRGHLIKESVGSARISVIREKGADGDITVKWKTVDKTAVNGKDYMGGEGVLEFKHGETRRTIDIPIENDMDFEKDENFEVEIFDPSGGAKIGRINRTAVTITNDDEFNSVMNKMLLMTRYNVDSMRVHNETWGQQLMDAMNVNGGDVENATAGDYVMHFLTFGFKIIFAFIPPAGMAGGWPCFCVSLIMIGLLTCIVGDLAGIFGCLVGLKGSITAITLVALGTSLPDTFASKAAAVGERTADNAIGNITGSNSVNVFLGLGLPWLIAAIYHTSMIGVTIIDDNQWEPDEEFFIKLTLCPGEDSENVRLGRTSIMEITILNDDEPGLLQFEKRGHLIKESVGSARISVIREKGADGDITVKWKTVDKTAVNGKDYMGGEGVLEFKHGETRRTIDIPIENDMDFEKDENFEVEIFDPSGGAKIGRINRTAVTITNDDEFNSVMNKMLLMTRYNVDSMRVHNETWGQQLMDAMNVNGGDVENATAGDYVMHFLTFGFKIIFAFIPPAGMAGGWPCFCVSLIMIGLLTCIVGDLAGIFGCLVGLKGSITAITLVALGTSLPDTFASKAAAVGERTADNAIGNITGSNSVNVFLGLGLPWLIAAIYHTSMGSRFLVDAGSLGFTVMLYTLLALVGIAILMFRRNSAACGRAELGGPTVTKRLTGMLFVSLWVVYVALSASQAYGWIGSSP
eukprot:snap_masked-scaffold634_size121673-processed-gene-0.12 protein:Tk06604 transcript:snap_masked-scaffold634_size121673-processed-gene-0.12-mRNA-1 annotation:"hypothetical protein DAPPUDRAFT_328233"